MKLNLGVGNNKIDGFVGVDLRKEVNPDVLCDITQGLPFDDNSIDEVLALDFLEHIPIEKTIFVITEIWRVLKHGGGFFSRTPDAEYGQGAWIDPTHINPWVEGRWLYFSREGYRKVYNIDANFEIMSLTRALTDPSSRIYHLNVEAKAVKNV